MPNALFGLLVYWLLPLLWHSLCLHSQYITLTKGMTWQYLPKTKTMYISYKVTCIWKQCYSEVSGFRGDTCWLVSDNLLSGCQMTRLGRVWTVSVGRWSWWASGRTPLLGSCLGSSWGSARPEGSCSCRLCSPGSGPHLATADTYFIIHHVTTVNLLWENSLKIQSYITMMD